jgi:hypothetical protein
MEDYLPTGNPYVKPSSRVSFSEFQNEVGEWGNKTFTKASQMSRLAHLKREVNELIESQDPKEAADCLILLLHWSYNAGVDLFEVAKVKHEINKMRVWGEPDSEGVVEHIKNE